MIYARVHSDHGIGCTISTLVPEYEVPVLRMIHGDTSVTVESTKEVKKEFDAEKAYDFLTNKYRQKESKTDPVRAVYRDVGALERAVSKKPVK